jgi:hypothetical protein
MPKEYNMNLVKVNKDKRGVEVNRQLAIQRKDKCHISFGQVNKIYQGLLRQNIPHDKIRIVFSNPYENHYTIKGIRDYDIANVDDDDYWDGGVSQEIRDKLKEMDFVHFYIYK